jgi:hypothetical protein
MRRRIYCLLAALPLLTTACSITTPQALSQRQQLIFVGPEVVFAEREYIDRYTCRNGRPLACHCESRVSSFCRCGCN